MTAAPKRGVVAAKIAIEPIVSSSTWSNDARRISASPSCVSPRLSKVPRRLRASSTLRDSHVCDPEVPRIDAAEEHAGRPEDGGDVGHGPGLASEWSGKAMEHAGERGGVERALDGKRLADIGFDRRDLEMLQAPGGMVQDMRIRVEEGDRAVFRKSGPFQEVARARADVQVPVADVAPVRLHESDASGSATRLG